LGLMPTCAEKRRWKWNALMCTIHAYTFDILGRQTQDRVIAMGSGLDASSLRIATAYEIRGMVASITSFDSASPDPCDCEAGIINQTLYTYNTFGQLITDQQSHDGAVSVSTSPKVQYTYATGGSSSNQIRPLTIIYPDGRIVTYNYGTASAMNDKLNRVESLDE